MQTAIKYILQVNIFVPKDLKLTFLKNNSNTQLVQNIVANKIYSSHAILSFQWYKMELIDKMSIYSYSLIYKETVK